MLRAVLVVSFTLAQMRVDLFSVHTEEKTDFIKGMAVEISKLL